MPDHLPHPPLEGARDLAYVRPLDASGLRECCIKWWMLKAPELEDSQEGDEHECEECGNVLSVYRGEWHRKDELWE